ncbi:helix-turn-helix transcriptional regulator [Gynurincola endophyticus]|uniref:helix-turn-helix transcriptional regulator n=1 Tax=Gynurincola endophyticus TaxID=2479004 RepID=UPI000F8D634C|nr:YafY family protein [Gynurincola endophyticus]
MIEPQTIKKFDRLVSIFFLLQSKPSVKGKELADRFEVSLRTIYRDIHTLQVAGVPIIGEPGSGYSIMAGYKLPPILFTNEEALSIAAVEKLAEKQLDKTLWINYKQANEKIKSVLRYNDKEQVDYLSKNIAVHNVNLQFNEQLPNGLSQILKSISDRKQLLIEYQKGFDKEMSERIIEPLGVFLKNRYWYVYAYCILRRDYRHFRIDRIQQAQNNDQPFTKEHKDVQTDFKEGYYPRKRAVIEVAKKYAFLFDWDKQAYGFLHEEIKDDLVVMHFDTYDLVQAFPRWLMMYADIARIISPQELKDNFLKLRQKIDAFQLEK